MKNGASCFALMTGAKSLLKKLGLADLPAVDPLRRLGAMERLQGLPAPRGNAAAAVRQARQAAEYERRKVGESEKASAAERERHLLAADDALKGADFGRARSELDAAKGLGQDVADALARVNASEREAAEREWSHIKPWQTSDLSALEALSSKYGQSIPQAAKTRLAEVRELHAKHDPDYWVPLLKTAVTAFVAAAAPVEEQHQPAEAIMQARTATLQTLCTTTHEAQKFLGSTTLDVFATVDRALQGHGEAQSILMSESQSKCRAMLPGQPGQGPIDIDDEVVVLSPLGVRLGVSPTRAHASVGSWKLFATPGVSPALHQKSFEQQRQVAVFGGRTETVGYLFQHDTLVGITFVFPRGSRYAVEKYLAQALGPSDTHQVEEDNGTQMTASYFGGGIKAGKKHVVMELVVDCGAQSECQERGLGESVKVSYLLTRKSLP